MGIAGLAGANPTIFDAGEAFAVEGDGSLDAGTIAQDLCVKDRYSEECCQASE